MGWRRPNACVRRARGAGEPIRLGNSLETLPGAVWPEIVNGISGGRQARFYHSRKLHTGEAGFRRIEADEVNPAESYWAIAAAHGRRVAAFDQPQSVPVQGLNGCQLMEWGVHDRSFGTVSEPPELLAEIEQRFGKYPVDNCDEAHGGSDDGYLRLLDDLMRGVALKEELYLDQLGRESWDLFACGFCETHCSGHQFWHFHDPNDRAHDPRAHPRLLGAGQEVYERVDAAIGKLVEAAGPDANILVFASHGMGLYIGGYQMLPEILNRLGYGSGSSAAASVRSRIPAGFGGFSVASCPRRRDTGFSLRLARCRSPSTRRRRGRSPCRTTGAGQSGSISSGASRTAACIPVPRRRRFSRTCGASFSLWRIHGTASASSHECRRPRRRSVPNGVRMSPISS